MEKLKGKYEVILGFATLVISLSAFKEELSKVKLDLGFTILSVSEYFLYCVFGFSACLYMYIIEHIVRDTKIGHWKIFDYLIGFAFTIFAFILISPILIVLDLFTIKMYNIFAEKEKINKGFIIITLIINIISIIGTIYAAKRLYDNRIKLLKEEAENEEIIALETSIKLNEEGYYAHSVLESFKVLETFLYKKIVDKNHRVSKALMELLRTALKLNIINKDDSNNISILIRLRNAAAHNSDIRFTKENADFALNTVKELINRK